MREYLKSSGSDKSGKSKSPFLHLINPATGQPNSNVKFYVHSNDPDEFMDDEIEIPSVAAELNYNFKQYHVERGSAEKEYLRINSYPLLISTIVDTIRFQVRSKNPPGEHPSLCCIVSLGITLVQSRRVVKKLGELNMLFKRRQKKGNELELYVQNFLKSNVDCPVEKAKYLIIKLTPEVNDVLSQISFDTGMSKSSAATLAIYGTLAQQIETPPNYKEMYQERFDTTIKMLECKLDAVKAMVARLDKMG